MTTTTIAETLRIKPHTAVWAMPPEQLDRIGPLPGGVTVAESPDRADTALLFVDSHTSARTMLDALAVDLGAPRMLWVAFPADAAADVDRDALTAMLAEVRRRPVSRPVTLDETWMAIRFGRMKPGEPSPALAPGAASRTAPADLPAGLSAPARNGFAAAGIASLADVATWRKRDILALHGSGPKTIGPLEEALAAARLTFAED